MTHDLATLSVLDLELVTGGKSPTVSAGSSGINDQVLSTLQNIQSSLKDLGKNNNGGLFGGNNGLLFMTMAMALSRRSQVVVYGGGRGYSWRSW